MKNSDKLLGLYDELIVSQDKTVKDHENMSLQERHESYKDFMEFVQDRIDGLKDGKKLNYDDGDQKFLDKLFVSSNPVSTRGSYPILDEDLKSILGNEEFIGLIEETMLNPSRESWGNLTNKGKNIFKNNQLDNQPLRLNRISASCSTDLIPLPFDSAFKKLVKYLNDNEIFDFNGIAKDWYSQNEYLTKQIHETFKNKILDENDFTDKYWLNLFAWSLYDKKVNQSESKSEATTTLTPTLGAKKMENSLNRILFGAAGTGKTFHTINHALSIIENKSLELLEKEDRIVLKKRFDDYKDQGQIKFVTFHQSFSYEDFVEGIRAESVQDNEGVTNIEYPIISGVFKSLCDTAITKTIIENQDSQFDENRNNIWKMSLGRAGAEEEIYQYCLQNDCVLIGWGDDLDFSEASNKKQIEEFMDKNGYREYRGEYPSASRFVNDFKNKMQNGDLIIVSEGNHKFRAIAEIIGDYSLLSEGKEIPDYVQKRAVKWLKTFKPALAVDQLFDKVLSQQTIYNLANAINFQKLKNILYTSATVAAENKKFVLIIDEINRGNISRIFGELITLIEDSKRVGADEALSVTLPYSKEEFSVPDNVYIIGTMNSSDRSLTGLDIALRRRFTFIEMPPKPELLDDVVIEGLNIGMLLKVINQRIEVLLDRDHCIGHANFMTLTSNSEVKELAQIFKQKIIPQLQEYFFDDWAKINMVLNANGMLKSKAIESSRLFPNVDTDSEGFFEEQKIWQLVETAFDSVDSFNKIIKH